MRNKTLTFKCDICGRKLTFYKNSYSYDGCSCPICDQLGYKPILYPINNNIFYRKRAVAKTRKLYKEQSKRYWLDNPNGRTIEQVLND